MNLILAEESPPSPSEARASRRALRIVCSLSIIGFVLLILLSVYNNQRKSETRELFMPYISEFTALKDVAVRSNIRTHKGNVVIIDYEREALSEDFLLAAGVLSDAFFLGPPKGLIAKTPEQVKTLIFLKDIPVKWIAKYSGSISILSVNKRESMDNDLLFRCYKINNRAINIYAEATELRIVDRLSGELIETMTFNSLTRNPLPKTAPCCVKMIGDYRFSNDHYGPLIYKNQRSCGLLFRYRGEDKKTLLWEYIKSYYHSH